jgi:hypothetical protein
LKGDLTKGSLGDAVKMKGTTSQTICFAIRGRKSEKRAFFGVVVFSYDLIK